MLYRYLNIVVLGASIIQTVHSPTITSVAVSIVFAGLLVFDLYSFINTDEEVVYDRYEKAKQELEDLEYKAVVRTPEEAMKIADLYKRSKSTHTLAKFDRILFNIGSEYPCDLEGAISIVEERIAEKELRSQKASCNKQTFDGF